MATSGQLAGRVVLVLENDYFAADDERAALEAEGARVLGPFSQAGQAIAAAERARPDCALVDINLGSGPDFAAARELIARGVPIVFVTGYERAVLPSDLAAAAWLQKPFTEDSLVAAAAAVLGPAPAS